jgi:hypothetical protein
LASFFFPTSTSVSSLQNSSTIRLVFTLVLGVWVDQLPRDLLAFFQSTISFLFRNKRRVLCQRKNMSLRRNFHFYLKTPTNHGSAKAAINWLVSLLQDVVSFSLC